jgi:hypothetical protein
MLRANGIRHLPSPQHPRQIRRGAALRGAGHRGGRAGGGHAAAFLARAGRMSITQSLPAIRPVERADIPSMESDG